MGEVQDPNVRPEGYVPPKIAEELLERYGRGERYFKGANLEGANLMGVNLEGANLEKVNLEGAILQGANLEGTNFQGGNLQLANLQDADLRETNLGRADLREARLFGANLRKAHLVESKLWGADLQTACLQEAKFLEVSLQGAAFQEANLQGADLQGADLRKGDFPGANFRAANLQGADLRAANLWAAVFHGAHLLGANLQGACLSETDFQSACLTEANLEGADLQGADLRAANLQGAKLFDAVFAGSLLDHADFTNASGVVGALTLQMTIDAGIKLPADHTGLTLFFSTRLSPVDRHLIDRVIYGVLGLETDCRVVEFKEKDDTAILRLQADSQQDLEDVAESLHLRVWEQEAKVRDDERAALVRQFTAVSRLEQLEERLSDLVDRADRFELWGKESDVIEYLEGEATERRTKEDQKLLRTWEQKLLRAGSKGAVKRIAGDDVVGLITDDS